MRGTSWVAFARRCLLLATLSMVPRVTLLAQAEPADSALSQGKPKPKVPNLAFSIGGFSAPFDSSSRAMWTVTQFTYIPARWPRWEIGWLTQVGTGFSDRFEETRGQFSTHLTAGGSSLLLGHRWAPASFLRLGARGSVGSLKTEYKLCRPSQYGCLTESKNGRIGTGSINALTELKVWRWVHAEVNAGYRVTGQPSAPYPVTGSGMSGFTYGLAIRLGKFP